MSTETLEQYMKRREAVRAELVTDDGQDDWLVMYALGKIPPSTYPTMDAIFQPGWMFKRQAE